jgi:hypothetical protein
LAIENLDLYPGKINADPIWQQLVSAVVVEQRNATYRNRILYIKISVVDPDPERHHFGGSGLGSASRACRSGSLSAKKKAELYFFPKSLNKLYKI